MVAVATREQRYVPAAGRAAFTGVYDRVVAATMREAHWRHRLATAALDGLQPGATVVDVGAGTGAVAIELARTRPDVAVLAVDGDPAALAIARGKPGADGIAAWHEALADALPLPDGGADRVVMSLLLHHLGPEQKRAALVEAHRVLRPGGELHVADWGRPPDPFTRAGFFVLQLLDGFAGTRDHAAGRLPSLIAAAGFAGPVSASHRLRTVWGSLELLRARRA